MNHLTSALLTIILLLLLIKSALADDYPNTIGPFAPIITVGTAISGVIDARFGDVDVFQIKLIAGRTYRVTMQALSPPDPTFDTQLTVYDSEGTQVAANNDLVGTNAGLEYTAPATGFYYIKAQAATIYVGGTYALAVIDRVPCSAGCSSKFYCV